MTKLRQLKITAWVVCMLMYVSPAISQDFIEVKGIVGEAEIVGRITEDEAQKRALNNAKVEALRKAGVGENIQSYENLFRSEMNMDYSEFFSSDVHSEVRGAVQEYQIVKQRRKLDDVTNLFMVEVTIDAKVIFYKSSPDPEFIIKVDGIKGIYEEGELLTFSVQSSQECYLHVFSITDNNTSLMYPNKWEKLQVVNANKQVEFPFKQYIDYELFKSGKEIDTHRLVFVFTKKPIRFTQYTSEGDQLTSAEAIFSWIYSIMPEERMVDYHAFTVR